MEDNIPSPPHPKKRMSDLSELFLMGGGYKISTRGIITSLWSFFRVRGNFDNLTKTLKTRYLVCLNCPINSKPNTKSPVLIRYNAAKIEIYEFYL